MMKGLDHRSEKNEFCIWKLITQHKSTWGIDFMCLNSNKTKNALQINIRLF